MAAVAVMFGCLFVGGAGLVTVAVVTVVRDVRATRAAARRSNGTDRTFTKDLPHKKRSASWHGRSARHGTRTGPEPEKDARASNVARPSQRE